MRLEDTIGMMTSNDYKERFKAEYHQLRLRIHGLSEMLEKYRDGTLNFTPTCSYDLLNGQLRAMKLYRTYLEERAQIEKIQL